MNLIDLMMKDPFISLIIRTKNEERWISSCLKSVFNQTYKNIEVIVVDNNSTDQTLRRVKTFPVKVVSIIDFKPGKAINDGIRESSGEYIICLSGHCVPTNSNWLKNLISELTDDNVAGVYGRQEPLSFTSDFDKRDLLTVFGLDKKIQLKDSFFHNANSAFRRDVWERFPFDEDVTNIEDRVWGRQVISAGMKIIYEPAASVYHWHGIHHDLNPERAKKIVRILEGLDGLISKPTYNGVEDMDIVAIIPVRGLSKSINSKNLLEYTVLAAKKSKLIKQVIVAADNEMTADLAKSFGATVPFIRPKELSEDYVDTIAVLRYSLDMIEAISGVPDLVVSLEETYPFRSPQLLDNMICHLVKDGLDTVIAAKPEMRGIWLQTEGKIELMADGFMPSVLKKSRAMVGLMGLACITHPMFIRGANFFGERLGVFEVEDPFASVQIRDGASIALAEEFLDSWWQTHYST